MKCIRFEDLGSELPSLIQARQSFAVIALGPSMSEAVDALERAIEGADLRCRVYLHGRTVPAMLTAIVLGNAQLPLFLATHNLLTFNPDYEIAKHKADNKLTVTYKKSG